MRLFADGQSEAAIHAARAGAAAFWTVYEYDALGRTVRVTSPDGVSAKTYSYLANTVTVNDEALKWKKYTTDALGQLIQVEEPRPAGGTYATQYAYDALGSLTAV